MRGSPPATPVPLHRTALLAVLGVCGLGVCIFAALVTTACAAPGPREGTPEMAATAEAEPGAEGRGEEDRPGGSLEGEYRRVEIATVGWDQLTRAPIVLLREIGSGQVVPIWVGVAEARAIALALHEVTPPRPMTHDLLAKLVTELGAELEEVVVHDLVDSTYYGFLRLRVPDQEESILVDTRPSDGLALAARTGAAISIAVDILQESPDYDFLAPDEGQQVVRLSGLTLVSPNDRLRRQFELGEEPGVLVTRATGVAAVQGLRRGDLIQEIGGEAVGLPMDFLDALKSTPPEEPLVLTVFREGERFQVSLFPDRSPPGRDEDRGPKPRV